MKKTILILFTAFLFSVSLMGCSKKEDTTSSGDIQNEQGEYISLLNEIIELPYQTMTVKEYNQVIQDICTAKNSNIFEVISKAYDIYGVYDSDNQYIGTQFEPVELEQQMKTTLQYSSQEIFGEPTYLGSVAYFITEQESVMELFEKENQLSTLEWNNYFNSIIDQITEYVVIHYEIHYVIIDDESITVSERDATLNSFRSEMETFILTMTEEEIQSENFEEIVNGKLIELSEQFSTELIQLKGAIFSVERLSEQS